MDLVAQLRPRGVQVEVEVTAQPFQESLKIAVHALAALVPGQNHTLIEGQTGVTDEQFAIHRHLGAESRALRAGPKGSVEREGAGLDLGQSDRVPVRAAQLLAEGTPG